MTTYKLISVVLVFLLFNKATARNYSVTILDSKLPTPPLLAPVVYDGAQSIYIIGGEFRNGTVIDELLEYNIATDTVQVLAGNVVPTMYGSGVWDPIDQSIYYFGGLNPAWADEPGIWKIRKSDPETLIKLAELPNGLSFATSVWNRGEYIYVIGGFQFSSSTLLDTVVRFSKHSNETEVISRTPIPVYASSSVWDPFSNAAYVFGGNVNTENGTNSIFVFHETSGAITKLDVDLPYPLTSSCAVLTGQEAYIVGGFGGPPSVFSFLKFDLVTKEVTQLMVENFLISGSGFDCTWVESLNRIYIFGGWYGESGTVYQDIIMYIDMNEDTDITTVTEGATTDLEISSTSTYASTHTTEELDPATTDSEIPSAPTGAPTTEEVTKATTDSEWSSTHIYISTTLITTEELTSSTANSEESSSTVIYTSTSTTTDELMTSTADSKESSTPTYIPTNPTTEQLTTSTAESQKSSSTPIYSSTTSKTTDDTTASTIGSDKPPTDVTTSQTEQPTTSQTTSNTKCSVFSKIYISLLIIWIHFSDFSTNVL